MREATVISIYRYFKSWVGQPKRHQDFQLFMQQLQKLLTKVQLNKDARINSVRRQGFWNQRRPNLRESLAHLVDLIMRLAGGDASVAFRASFV